MHTGDFVSTVMAFKADGSVCVCVCVCVCVLGRKLDVVPIQCPRGGDSYPAFELDLGRRKIRSVLGSVKKPVIRHGRTESIIS